MDCVIVKRKTSYGAKEDGITTYHAALFHGNFINKKIDHNHLGKALTNPLRLEKNAYDCRHIIQIVRNLIVPQHVKERLKDVPNVDFFQVVFEKLFFHPFEKGDMSVGPKDVSEFHNWWNSFRHEPNLIHEIEPFFELIIPELVRLESNFPEATTVQFNLVFHRTSQLKLCKAMLDKFPIIWTTEGIVFRKDIFALIEESFSWTYFHQAGFVI